MNTYLANPEKQKKLRLLCIDAMIVFAVILLSYLFRILIYEGGSLQEVPQRITWLTAIAVIVHLLSFYIFGLYEISDKKDRKILFINVFLSVVSATIFVALFSYVFPEEQMGRVLTFVHFLLMTGVMFLQRLMLGNKLVSDQDKRVIIIGWNDLVKKLANNLSSLSFGYKVKGLVLTTETETPKTFGNPAPVYDSLETALSREQPEAIVITNKLRRLGKFKERLVDYKFQGKEIYAGTAFYERVLGKVPVSEITEGWLLYKGMENPFRPNLYNHIKRLIDFSGSALVLLISLPMMAVIALLIKLDSRGPVLFRQERLGLNEQPFTLMKFRTMVDDAEKDCGPCWATENDPRLTRMGQFLRKTRLDEFPQFINVLKGDMSLIGPRPIRKYFADHFSQKFPFYRLRFRIKPGITGWAQVNMAYVNTEEDQYDKLEYEFFYLYHQSLFLDLYIMLKTVQSVVKMKGG